MSTPSKMSSKKMSFYSKRIQNDIDEVATTGRMCVVDLPDLVLDCILERLSPEGLCSMAGVCKSLRERCVSDRLWDRHMMCKWGRAIGPAAHREWHMHLARSSNENSVASNGRAANLVRSLYRLWPLSLVAPNLQNMRRCCNLPTGSVMSWYLALETGKFWFPAQVYNREHGHVGFMLSCYDAKLCYDPRADTFQASYPPHGKRAVAVEKGISWDRLRAAPIDTSPYHLHISECLNDLRPGDHIEIQWRRNKEFPYGWWYGVVGHLEFCDTSHCYCQCHQRDTIVLEFNQYTVGSRWRRALINRKDHREEGNEVDGFYGGIRKLYSNDDISTWKSLWPPQVLE